MNQMHFQTELFSEILSGLSESFKGLSIQAELLIKAATEIYINAAAGKTKDAAEEKTASLPEEVRQTDFIIKSNEMREVHCMGIIECKSCGYEHGKFIGEKMNFCPGCGKSIRR